MSGAQRAHNLKTDNGAAGNVGAYAVQVAKLSDLHVIATAASGDLDYVRGLGAEKVRDYKKEQFEESLNGVGIVLDRLVGRRRSVLFGF